MSSILIIGGNSDIGFATAKVFAKNEYDIHLASRNIDQLNIKKNEIESLFKVKCNSCHTQLALSTCKWRKLVLCGVIVA